jgi:hypothetical protein
MNGSDIKAVTPTGYPGFSGAGAKCPIEIIETVVF